MSRTLWQLKGMFLGALGMHALIAVSHTESRLVGSDNYAAELLLRSRLRRTSRLVV